MPLASTFLLSTKPGKEAYVEILAARASRPHDGHAGETPALPGAVLQASTMEPFDFQSRTRLIFGAGSFERLGALASELGFRRTLLVADKGILGGVSLGRLYPGADPLQKGLVVAVTETVTDEDIGALEAGLKEQCQ